MSDAWLCHQLWKGMVEQMVFDNHQIDVSGNVAIAMGNYFFTCECRLEARPRVVYPFGYKKYADG